MKKEMKALFVSLFLVYFLYCTPAAATEAILKPAEPEPKYTNSIGMTFVYIRPGTFIMGSPADEPGRDSDETQHKVTLTKGFYMGETEVTVGQWRAFSKDSGYKTEAETSGGTHFWERIWVKKAGIYWDNPDLVQSENHPVTCLSWNDVQEFIRWLNRKEGASRYRLPTEAEWEYAARAGTATPFSTGKCLSTDHANYDGSKPLAGCSRGSYRETTVRTGAFAPNKLGLYDMHGNVWEWCQDWYGNYPPDSITDPAGPSSGSRRVIRSGSWYFFERRCRSADRFDITQNRRSNNVGFRLCRMP
ncbi:MAG: formylglycine-generating enzyme family protein [Desulfobacteraceae bacterium]|nr:MAG: formylglycine-generating enzyme family protein [Desulfobacteraceae bacterium]